MAMMEKPEVVKVEGGKAFEHTFDSFKLKVFVPDTTIDGKVNNYTFRAPLLLVFEEQEQDLASAVRMAETTGLAKIASSVESSVLFVYPTCEGGWKNAPASLYADLISEIKMSPDYEDGIITITDMFTREFKGHYVRGAIFRADIYSFGESADYVATNLLKKVDGEYLWGPGEITPAMCSMEGLSVIPNVTRKDIGILSVGNSAEINKAFAGCENLLIKEKAEYEKDFKRFVRKFKMWCGNMEIEPDFDALNMTEEAGFTLVNTASDHRGKYVGTKTHKVGYFAYYNNDAFKDGPIPLLMGFHGAGDSSMFLTFVSGWWEVCHKYGFLYVAIDNHQDACAAEVLEVIRDIQKKYNVDEHRIYATGFSMGSGKTWDMFQEYPEVFAGVAPQCALLSATNNPFGKSISDGINTNVAVPMFYAGGEKSFLSELPGQAESALDRIQYLAMVNKLKTKFDVDFADKASWADPFYGIEGDRVEKIKDESRGSTLTVRYYESEDGITRTALASVSEQVHECRHHTNEIAWNFISKFTR